MSVLQHESFLGHEQVIFASDQKSGLKAIIAIHNTNRGPALGGCRMWNYADEKAALTDVLRLSRGMSYKAALADLGLGGGKAVIIGDPRIQKTPELMRALGVAVQRLGGRYYTAEDVGTTVDDMSEIRKGTEYVVGLPKELGGTGDPSATTAWGCFIGMKAAAKRGFGTDSFSGIKVSVQGLGNVGWHLARLLHEANADLVVSDIDDARLKRAREEFDAEVVSPESIYNTNADIFAPCALGAVLNDETLHQLKVKVIAGAANNQLKTEKHGEDLFGRKIIYAPDYIVNAAGLIKVASERTGYDHAWVKNKVASIGDTLNAVFDLSEAETLSTNFAAQKIANARLSM